MTTVTVEGMSCDHCEQTVEDAVRALGDVTTVAADRDAGQVRVEGHADVDDVVQAIEDAGYTARP